MIRKFTPEGATTSSVPAADLEKQYEQASRHGNVSIGDDYLFIRGLLQIRYIPLRDIVWGYLRQEDSSASVCCGRTSIPSYFLIVVTADQHHQKITFDSSGGVLSALAAMQKKSPSIAIGYSEQLARQFAV